MSKSGQVVGPAIVWSTPFTYNNVMVKVVNLRFEWELWTAYRLRPELLLLLRGHYGEEVIGTAR